MIYSTSHGEHNGIPVTAYLGEWPGKGWTVTMRREGRGFPVYLRAENGGNYFATEAEARSAAAEHTSRIEVR